MKKTLLVFIALMFIGFPAFSTADIYLNKPESTLEQEKEAAEAIEEAYKADPFKLKNIGFRWNQNLEDSNESHKMRLYSTLTLYKKHEVRLAWERDNLDSPADFIGFSDNHIDDVMFVDYSYNFD